MEKFVLLVFLLIKRGGGKNCVVNPAIVDMYVHRVPSEETQTMFLFTRGAVQIHGRRTWRVGWTTVPDEQ